MGGSPGKSQVAIGFNGHPLENGQEPLGCGHGTRKKAKGKQRIKRKGTKKYERKKLYCACFLLRIRHFIFD